MGWDWKECEKKRRGRGGDQSWVGTPLFWHPTCYVGQRNRKLFFWWQPSVDYFCKERKGEEKPTMVVLFTPVSTSHTRIELSHPAVMMSSSGHTPSPEDHAHTTVVMVPLWPWKVAKGVRVTDFHLDPVLGFLVGGKFGSCSESSNVLESGT